MSTPSPADVFEAFFDLALIGGILFAPVRDAAGAVADLSYVRLNLVAQRLLALPERPPETFLTRYPHARQTGVFAFYRDAYESGEARQAEFNYQHDGLDNYFHLAARRVGEQLLVSFTDTSEQPRTAVEEALRESQAREQAARAEAEAERQRFYEVLMQLPAQVATYHGPEHVYQFVNARYRHFVAQHELLGRTVREAGQGAVPPELFALFDHVYATGEPVQLREVAVVLDRYQAGPAAPLFIDAFYLPLRDAAGGIDGVLDFSYDVTELVLARRQVEQLNQQLEARVQERTAQLTEQQSLLRQILHQLPAFVATLSGPAHRFSFANDLYQQLVAGRATLGASVAEALPEVTEQGFTQVLDQVYATGQPYLGREVAVILHPPGQPTAQHYLDLTYQPLADGQGLVQGILVFAVDVTEQVRTRRQAETLQAAILAVAQRQAQERQDLYQIFEQAPVAVVLLREPDHRIDYANPAFKEVFPPEPGHEILRGHTLPEAYPHLNLTGLVELLDGVFRTGEPQVVLEMPLADFQPGSPRFVTFSYQPYREEGRIVGVAAFLYDVTEQVLTRRRVEQAATELRLLTAHASAFLFRTDAAGHLVYLNDSFFAWTGLEASRLASLDEGWAAVHPDDLAAQQPGFAAAVAAGQPWQSTPYRFRRHDGHYRWMLSRSQPIVGADGKVSGHTGLTFEIHDQVELQRQLERTNADLDTFVYTASHDLKAPIANIEGLLDALREFLPTEAQAPMVPRLMSMMEGAISRFQQT
ncbi:MAG: PAS domain S-box protein, partial [Cytophagaceae bacterium]